MNGRILGVAVLGAALLGGGLMYYMQVYAFYRPVTEEEAAIALVPAGEETPVPVPVLDFDGIDANSSPLRFRACFSITPETRALDFAPYPQAEPLNAPNWFSCFDAAELGADLVAGRAEAWLSVPEIAPGVDRVVAVYSDGRAFAWHQLNDSLRD
ncbi:DUF6446 family protein [Halodurantibacterium flavum]|uniref:DUF6446 family protein n=1 Tax=Halodurantibacterium flavum TaxID=1382802 RepID=A0ABW4S700_9RHOB